MTRRKRRESCEKKEERVREKEVNTNPLSQNPLYGKLSFNERVTMFSRTNSSFISL